MRARRIAYKASITNRNQGGGNKKSGLPPSVGQGAFSICRGLTRAYGSPSQRRKVYFINQLAIIELSYTRYLSLFQQYQLPFLSYSLL